MLANASISYSSSRFADIIGACLMVVSHVAHAAPPPDADMRLAPWFHSLTIPNTGSSCCGAADWWWVATAIACSSKASGSRFRPQLCRSVGTIPPGIT
jgi:hypothetical protein